GLTFGCVQCHAHPYEPIQHDEYYKFYAFFNNTRDQDLSSHHPRIRVPNKHADFSKANQIQKQIDDLRIGRVMDARILNSQTPWNPISTAKITSNRTKIKTLEHEGYTEFRAAGTLSRNTTLTITHAAPVGMKELTAMRLDILPLDPALAAHSGEWGSVLSSVSIHYTVPGGKPQSVAIADLLGDDPSPPMNPRDSLNPKSSGGWGPYSKIYRARRAVLVLASPLALTEGGQLTVKLRYNQFLLASFPLVPRRGRIAVTDDPAWQKFITSAEAKANNARLALLTKQQRAIPATALPVLEQMFPMMSRETRVFDRGNWLNKTTLIPEPDVPASMPELKKRHKRANRLDLARWLVSPENPLTARVAVNRFWEQLFGYGLVETLEDFGSSGHLPSHPLLLDDLAVRFQTEMKWSVKSLIREIVLSATYRQSSKTSAELRAKDPRNMLLARGPRNRLSAEMIRDQALAVSGLLNRQQFGPAVYPPIPSGGYTPASGGGGTRWKTPKPGDPQRYRRAIYTYVKRSSPYPSFASFDAPSRENCNKRRIVSNTPIAALTTLNDPVFVECIARFAKRLDAIPSAPLEEKIAQGYRMATSQKIKPKQLKELLALHRRVSKSGQPKMAMETVASVLLNLDQALTH
ncbi:MAG: DUF1553 domain-containing protein, partial [Akkermansiaceae bacterium]